MPGPADAPTDAALLRAHVDGDPDAFASLFRRHRDRLWAVALRTTGNPEDAADALQDALVSAHRRASSYRGEAQVSTWLHRIVVNACLDRLRRLKVRAAEPLPDDLDEYADHALRDAAGIHSSEDPETVVLERDRRAVLLRVLAELPGEQRAALVLVDMEGYPVEEAAAVLEVPAGTVKSRCSRGRARLRELLAKQGVHGVHRVPGTDDLPGASDGRDHDPGGVRD